MEIIIKGEPKEIAALVLAVQGRQMEMEDIADGVGTIFATQVHQLLQKQVAEAQARRAAQ